MASLGPPPPGIDLHESRAGDLVASWASTWSLAVVSVMLRVVCRKLAKVRFWLDDWFIITSLFFSGGFMFTVTIYMVDNGMCRHIWAGPADATRDWALGLFTTEFTYTLSLVFIKWSILAFYWRIFSIQFLDKLCLWILAGMVACWGVAAILTSIFQCVPIPALWQQFDPVHPTDPDTFTCGVDIHNLFIGKAVPHIVTDALILIFPLPYIWHLHLRLSQKIATAGIFLVGIFVSIVSIVRFVFVLEVDLESPDVTWDQCTEMLWTGIEIYIGTVCACLPSLKPLLNLMLYGSVYPRSHRPTASDAQIMFEIAEATKRRCRQPSNANVSSSYIFASARGAAGDARVSEGLTESVTGSVTGSVPDDSPTIEMDDAGEHAKDCQ
ncbi:hypothetical protein A9Z42_0003790 [Trichoderma parareesei]|uniref:Rhodopsin domain-containing protein n=1 Tax=Trichoderma parareesei TaxID=858221 RepID=A0A2H2ZMU8_TRIPA|nr:hypothetical protein A9Z42_0003790 [Trichoderma parareesei]